MSCRTREDPPHGSTFPPNPPLPCPTRAQRLAELARKQSVQVRNACVDGERLALDLCAQGFHLKEEQQGIARFFYLIHPQFLEAFAVPRQVADYARFLLSSTAAPVPAPDDALLEAVRQIVPAGAYGYLNYLLAPSTGLAKGSDGLWRFTGSIPSLSQGYNCYDASLVLASELSRAGRQAQVVMGRDARGLFDRHVYVLSAGTQYDATPIFPFVHAGHPARPQILHEQPIPQAENTPPRVDNPLCAWRDPASGESFLALLEYASLDSDGTAQIELSVICAEDKTIKLSQCWRGPVAALRDAAGPDQRPWMDETPENVFFAAVSRVGRLTQTPSAGLRAARQVPLYQAAQCRFRGALAAILHKLAFRESYPL